MCLGNLVPPSPAITTRPALSVYTFSSMVAGHLTVATPSTAPPQGLPQVRHHPKAYRCPSPDSRYPSPASFGLDNKARVAAFLLDPCCAVRSGQRALALCPKLTQTSVKLYRLPSNVHRSPAGRRSICQNTWRPGGHASLKKARVVLGGEGCIFGVILSDALPDIVGHGLRVPGGGGLVLGELAVIASKLLLGEPAHGRKRRHQIDR